MLNLQYLVRILVPGEPTTYESEDIPIPRPTFNTYEYSINPFPTLVAPRAIIFNQGRNFVPIGNWQEFKAGARILVQDSEHSLYRGLIYCRMSQRAVYPVSLVS